MHFSSKIVLHELSLQSLKDMGAEVIDMDGLMVFARFEKDNFRVTYLYHRNPDNTFLLERIKPYQLVIGEYDSEHQVVENITNDMDQINNARNSHKFDSFVETLQKMNKFKRDFDDLFLYYNINSDDMQYIQDSIKKLCKDVYRIKSHSNRIYHKTDPQSLKDEEESKNNKK